jgi:hypothetical protein
MRAPRGRTPAQDAPAGFPESGRSIRAWVHHPADLTEREAATAWDHDRWNAHHHRDTHLRSAGGYTKETLR